MDGTLLPALPKMLWALWQNEEHRAAKLHLEFDIRKQVPTRATITHGNGLPMLPIMVISKSEDVARTMSNVQYGDAGGQ